tara:strand:+ start:274 stop:597 length:324 start_codon:yes stop_codon:yes gene_type:complete
MNSAMMPCSGDYECRAIHFHDFIYSIEEAHERKELESYIGYQQNCDLIYKWSGIKIEPNRSQTTLEHGDFMLVMKLKYRANPLEKGKEVKEDDFEFFIVRYYTTTAE